MGNSFHAQLTMPVMAKCHLFSLYHQLLQSLQMTSLNSCRERLTHDTSCVIRISALSTQRICSRKCSELRMHGAQYHLSMGSQPCKLSGFPACTDQVYMSACFHAHLLLLFLVQHSSICPFTMLQRAKTSLARYFAQLYGTGPKRFAIVRDPVPAYHDSCLHYKFGWPTGACPDAHHSAGLGGLS